MILIDANVLLYAYDASSPQHERARVWLETAMATEAEVGIGLTTALAFIRLSTDRRVFHEPLTVEAAIDHVSQWFARRNVSLAVPTEGHWLRLAGVAAEAKVRGALVMDAHLATLALERGAAIATSDRDFTRFAGLRLIDPTSA